MDVSSNFVARENGQGVQAHAQQDAAADGDGSVRNFQAMRPMMPATPSLAKMPVRKAPDSRPYVFINIEPTCIGRRRRPVRERRPGPA